MTPDRDRSAALTTPLDDEAFYAGDRWRREFRHHNIAYLLSDPDLGCHLPGWKKLRSTWVCIRVINSAGVAFIPLVTQSASRT